MIITGPSPRPDSARSSVDIPFRLGCSTGRTHGAQLVAHKAKLRAHAAATSLHQRRPPAPREPAALQHELQQHRPMAQVKPKYPLSALLAHDAGSIHHPDIVALPVASRLFSKVQASSLESRTSHVRRLETRASKLQASRPRHIWFPHTTCRAARTPSCAAAPHKESVGGTVLTFTFGSVTVWSVQCTSPSHICPSFSVSFIRSPMVRQVSRGELELKFVGL